VAACLRTSKSESDGGGGKPEGELAAAIDDNFGGFDKSKVSPISCPDNLAFDKHGNLWIATDGNALGSNDGLFAVALEGPNRGETRQFLTVPIGAETCGPIVLDDLVTVSVQHPGEHDDNSIDDPLSNWPDGGNGTARPSIVASVDDGVTELEAALIKHDPKRLIESLELAALS